MFTQDEIDAVLQNAQKAVDTLAEDVAGLEAEAGDARRTRTATTAVRSAPRRAAFVAPPERVRGLLGLSVPVVVRLAQRPMSVHEILNMGPGTILEFDRTVEQELDLMIGDCVIATGIAVKIGEHFGLRITRIGDVRDRIRSLGHG